MIEIKIAISSDNHLDVNKVNISDALEFQAHWLNTNHLDYYLYAGDLFNDFSKTKAYFEQLQQLTTNTRIAYILGNHDMLNNLSFSEAEHSHFLSYIHNQFIDLPNSDWRIIGNNGWYDYSFSTYHDQLKKVQTWKNVYWLDSSIDQPISDQERMATVIAQVKYQLDLAKDNNKSVLFLTHFAPRQELLAAKPKEVNTPRRERFYQMVNAMMGSDRLGNLLEDSNIVRYVFYGHLHGIHPPLTRHGVTYLNQSAGVSNKRINEWQKDNLYDQWLTTTRVINLP
ncbi:metallophosphoesterase [Limosilactobacillus vaginalis]|uniref:metallophosphoesterase n=1 Tax=Limosilactobacillus vaginalis TaxID=1633 RepID=UPI0038909569